MRTWRSAGWLLGGPIAIGLTACTALLGVEDVPEIADGGATNDASVGTPGTVEAAITKYATAFCQKRSECRSGIFTFEYRDLAECVSSFSATLLRRVRFPGVSAQASDFEGCSSRMTALTCELFLSNDSNFLCSISGALDNGALCVSNYQCKSALCGASLNSCGACLDPPVENAACADNGSCGPGLRCNGLRTCVKEAPLGQPCGEATPCQFGLYCVANTCQRLPDREGDSCFDDPGCDVLQGLYCYGGSCLQSRFVAPGEPCGFNGYAGEQPRLCLRGAACDEVCDAPPARAGDPCEGDYGFCLTPLVCVNGACAEPVTVSACQGQR